jgi:hypothetical protein
MDFPPQNVQQDLVIQTVETLGDVSLDEPGCSCPRVIDASEQCSVQRALVRVD